LLNNYITAVDDAINEAETKLYRLRIRFAGPRTDLRLGLQAINFGPGQMLRVLRWFDRLDPRDPLQLTDGVWGMRFRWFFSNNVNIWFWGVYGTGEVKGFESLPTPEGKIDFGGRAQIPVFAGELAVTAHTREVQGKSISADNFREIRLALDGRWDAGLGFWFEALIQHQMTEDIPHPWTKMLMLGTDYTVGFGNGLYASAEHLEAGGTEAIVGWKEDARLSAIFCQYPLTVLDMIYGYGFYWWDEQNFYPYLGWQRIYDNWVINTSFFWNPTTESVQLFTGQALPLTGWGFQIMLIFNH
jgi:hypothetical protein